MFMNVHFCFSREGWYEQSIKGWTKYDTDCVFYLNECWFSPMKKNKKTLNLKPFQNKIDDLHDIWSFTRALNIKKLF